MHSLALRHLESLAFSTEHVSTLKKIGESKGKQALFSQQTPEILDSLRQAAIVESSQSSNRMEGVVVPYKRVRALVLKSTAPQNRSEQEVAGYRDALDLIHGSAPYMDFSVNVIRQLHSTINRYMPDPGGQWKMAENDIVERNSDGSFRRTRFKTVSPVATPQAMEDLVGRYKEAVHDHRKEPLVVIPLAILDFLCIHPFGDGNGRVSRLLTLLLLYHFDYQVGRYIGLERIFEDSKETYYEALERSSQGWHEGAHDVFPWSTYFWGTLLLAYRELEDRVGKIRTGKGAKTAQVRMAVDRRAGPFAISEIESDCPGVSRDMIRLVLRQLRDEGMIVSQGKGRGARWIRK